MNYHEHVEDLDGGSQVVTRVHADRSITVKVVDPLGFTLGEIDGEIKGEGTPGLLLDLILMNMNH